ncbi:MAG: hypothetical protein JNJ40_15110 [Bacteroidia bacterium]|nr:hypothetical protein [Bacteroidia bacterium]
MEKVGNAYSDEAREHDITVEEVLAIEEFKNLSEEQAKEVVDFVRTVSTVFYSLYKKQYEPEIVIEDNETNNNYKPIRNAA